MRRNWCPPSSVLTSSEYAMRCKCERFLVTLTFPLRTGRRRRARSVSNCFGRGQSQVPRHRAFSVLTGAPERRAVALSLGKTPMEAEASGMPTLTMLPDGTITRLLSQLAHCVLSSGGYPVIAYRSCRAHRRDHFVFGVAPCADMSSACPWNQRIGELVRI